jgi:electron transport complex protein RnfG
MKSIARMVLVLGLVCTVAALSLSVVYEVTKEPIAEAYRQELLDAIGAVLPAFDNAPDADMVAVEGVDYYLAKAKGAPVGAAFKVSSTQGYSGLITALVGVDPEGRVTGVRILLHTETPGLGAKFTAPAFLAQFKGKTLGTSNWKVKKDGGDFEQITGATITPRALVAAIGEGLETFAKARFTVFEGGAR